MNYQRPENITAYAKEASDISCQMKQFHKNPGVRLKNNFRIHILLIIAACLHVLAILAFYSDEMVLVFMSGVLAFMIFILSMRVLSFKRATKLITDNQEYREIEIDQTGITSKYKDYCFTYYRDGIKCIRVFRYSILIIPCNPQHVGLILPIENLEQLEAGLKENNYNVEVIE